MKRLFLLLASTSLLFTACQQESPKNEVIVMGMIHSGHRTNPNYDIEVVKSLVRAIDPDYILTEIPPDRYPQARKEFDELDTIMESRVRVFPEYVDAIFPLTREMNFEIIPTAGWTKPMNDYRRQKLAEIRNDPERAEDWKAYQASIQRGGEAMRANGDPNDPYYINSDLFDSLVDIRYQVYNELFNEELLLGGWDNINIAHYWHIEKAIEKHRGEGKRFLITYGSAHKGWFLRELKKRDDIIIKEMTPYLDQVLK
ncbi:hypothetical protein BFP97_15550 [Roseivirga sp. 4D4]|uniref:hypothetical protein n=1 Tax=Roseivirga sp. 4D4 TaxID=1889784 RepID=UPI000853B16B|nr:hypothetical protein [Roseivirga sp. 4D4]OEK02850.1 hypothetical protein BFP97_15550 [Roseivirga sp. 4D4]